MQSKHIQVNFDCEVISLIISSSFFLVRWCGPCKLLGPRLESLSVEKGDKFHLAKVDIDNIPELAEEYNASLIIVESILNDVTLIAVHR